MIEWIDPRHADVVEFFKKAHIGDYWTCLCIPEAYLEGPHGQ